MGVVCESQGVRKWWSVGVVECGTMESSVKVVECASCSVQGLPSAEVLDCKKEMWSAGVAVLHHGKWALWREVDEVNTSHG